MSSGEINKKRLKDTDAKISKIGFNNSSAKWVKTQSILIALAGQGKTRGTVAINYIPLTTNQSIAAIEPNEEINAEYLYQNLNNRYDELRLKSSGDGTRGGLNKKIISELMIPIPELKEQLQIGLLLKTVDKDNDLHQRKLDILKNIKKAFLQHMFPEKSQEFPKLRFNNFSELWEQRKLGKVSDITKLAGFEFTKYVKYSDRGEIIALRGLNVKNGNLILDDVKYIDESDFSKLNRSKLYKNDILFTYVGTVGQLALVPQNNKYHLAPNVARIRMNTDIDPVFISQQMGDSNYYNKVIFPLIATSSQPALSMENIRKFLVFLPNLEEQNTISSFFEVLDAIITLHQRKLDSLERLKASYLQLLFPQ